MPFRLGKDAVRRAAVRLFYGLAGALLGAVSMAATAMLVASVISYDDMGDILALLIGAPIGLVVGIVAGQIVCSRRGKMRPGGSANVFVLTWFLAPIALTAITLWASEWRECPPSDSAMIRYYDAHRVELDGLVTMARQDKGIQLIEPDTTRPTNLATVGVSAQRLDRYRGLMRAAGVRAIQTDLGPAAIYLY